MSEDAIERRMAELRDLAGRFAKAYATREHLDEFKKSKLAMLMKQAERDGAATSAAQEREARANPQYLELLDGLRAAVEESEALRWQLKIAEIGAEVWRTRQSTRRAEMMGYGNKS
jgi:hypothetical protein